MSFDLKQLVPGCRIYNLAGSPVKFIAYVVEAKPAQRVVCLHDGDIVTFNDEGQFFGPHRPSKMDLSLTRPK